MDHLCSRKVWSYFIFSKHGWISQYCITGYRQGSADNQWGVDHDRFVLLAADIATGNITPVCLGKHWGKVGQICPSWHRQGVNVINPSLQIVLWVGVCPFCKCRRTLTCLIGGLNMGGWGNLIDMHVEIVVCRWCSSDWFFSLIYWALLRGIFNKGILWPCNFQDSVFCQLFLGCFLKHEHIICFLFKS